MSVSKLIGFLAIVIPDDGFSDICLMGTMVTIRVGPLVILRGDVGSWCDSLIIPIMAVVANLPSFSELVAKDKKKVIEEASRTNVNLYHLPKTSLVEGLGRELIITVNIGCPASVSSNFCQIIGIFWSLIVVRGFAFSQCAYLHQIVLERFNDRMRQVLSRKECPNGLRPKLQFILQRLWVSNDTGVPALNIEVIGNGSSNAVPGSIHNG